MSRIISKRIKEFIDIEKCTDREGYLFRIVTPNGREYPTGNNRLHSKFICDEAFKRLVLEYSKRNSDAN
jgi:hypothetical protein